MMWCQIIPSRLIKLLIAMVVVVQLVACGDDGGSEANIAVGNGQVPSQLASDVVLSGSVGDGPVTGASIVVYSNKGEQIGSMISDNTASFEKNFKVKGNQYPLLLEVNGGVDLVTGSTPDFQMLSVMMNPSDKQVNINPFSTLIVKIAESLPGGINSGNVNLAMNFVADRLAFGLDKNTVPDPITTPIAEMNVASLIKASEAMGEMVRRTRDRISESYTPLSGDHVMAAIAADMTDGFLDGVGAVGTDPKISAVANVVSGQVLIEALSNSLKVGGIIATDVIDQAIAITNARISSSQLTGSVKISAGLLKQARVSLVAAQVLDSSETVVSISNKVKNIAADASAQDVAAVLPPDTSSTLDYAVVLSVTADETQVSAINQVVSTDGSGGAAEVNTVPVINGSPAGSVTAKDAYVFQPVASDADNDVLSFSIANKPDWAGFNTTSGRLNGTPSDTDVGTYDNIVISVTDGLDTASLAAFSIRVDAVIAPNTAPILGGSPAGSVVAGSSYVFQASVSDADGDALTFSIANKPGWASFSATSGRLSGTPVNSDAGTYNNILISVTDGVDTASLAAFSIRVDAVIAPNAAPIIRGSPAGLVVAGSSYVFQPSASDADGDALSFRIANKPGWASFSTGTGRLSGTPANADARTYSNIVISVSDGQETVSLPAFSITVEAANTAPVISGTPAGTVVAGSGYSFQSECFGCRRGCAEFQYCQQAGLGELQHGDGSFERHAGERGCADLQQHRDFSERWPGDGVPAGFQHYG